MFKSNDGSRIPETVDRTTCPRHNVPEGVPCWTMPKNVAGGFGRYAAICGDRIRRAGWVGKISPESMRSRAPGSVERKNSSRPNSKYAGTRPARPNTK